MRFAAVIASLLTLVACAGKTKQEPLDKKTYDDHPVVNEETPKPLDEVECGRMYDHIADLALSIAPPAEQPKLREELEVGRKTTVDECVTGQVTREQYDCFIAATSWEALKDCVPKADDAAEVERVD